MGVEFDHNQYAAIEKLDTGKILIGGVGSGKSRTALAYYFIKVCGGLFPFNDGSVYRPMIRYIPLYIITTAKKRDTNEWVSECSKLGIGPERTTIDSWNNIPKYTNVCGAFFIFDEQRLVGNGTWVKSFYQIAKKNKWILLTATPGDSWSDYIPVFIANGFYKNRTQFKTRHFIMSPYTKYPKILRVLEEDRLLYLKDRITVYMNYESKNIRNDIVRVFDYDREKYMVVAEKRWNIFQNIPIPNISEVCYLLRKICNSDRSRIDGLKEDILRYGKVVIFYNYDYELEILRQVAKDLDIYEAEYNGHKHMPIPNTDSWVYLVQYSSGSEGWNCTQTDTIIFYSQTYSYKQLEQSRGRIDRRDTKYNNLYYIYYISNSPIDKAIKRAQDKKQDFNERVFMEN